MNGSNDPENRLPLWPFGFQPTSPLALFVAALNKHRSQSRFFDQAQTEEWSQLDLYPLPTAPVAACSGYPTVA